LECLRDPVERMTEWVKTGQCNSEFSLGEECELQSETNSSRVIRCKNQDLGTDEILAHIKAGMRVTKLALTWRDRLDFVIDEKLMLKRICFTDVMQDELAKSSESADDTVTQFDVDFSIMTLEYAAFINDLIVLLGGVRIAEAEHSRADVAKENPVLGKTITIQSQITASQSEMSWKRPEAGRGLIIGVVFRLNRVWVRKQ